MKQIVSENLKQIRVKANLTQEQLSERSGVSRTTIIQLENGNVDSTRTTTLQKLADALGCKITDFFAANV